MRQSRNVWFLGLSFLCLIAIFTFKTPQMVISTLADPEFGNTPITTVQHFWNLMDCRQMELARELLILSDGSSDEQEIKNWETLLNKDPLLSLQKVEFLNSNLKVSQSVVVRVSWASPIQNVQQVVFSMSLKQTEKGWRIQGIKRINYFS